MASQTARRVPSLVYGTAWKKEATSDLVHQAILAGFRGIDTAAQPKHYREDLVGSGIRSAMKAGQLARQEVYIQTKFTSVHGQDAASMPYRAEDSISSQVLSSVESSLSNLRTASGGEDGASYIDCLVLHSPFPSSGQTMEAWAAMETFVPDKVRTLGISNIYRLAQLQQLHEQARVKPAVVQNRFYEDTSYDQDIRGFCQQHGIVYQSFWTLTANPHLLRSRPVAFLAQATNTSKQVALYALVLGLGDHMSVLNGTTNHENMAQDLQGLQIIANWSAGHEMQWKDTVADLQRMLTTRS